MSRHRLTALLSNIVIPATGIPRRLPPITFGSSLPPGFHSIPEESHNNVDTSNDQPTSLVDPAKENRRIAEALTKVPSAVGRPLHTNNVTVNARVLIEVDVSQPLIEHTDDEKWYQKEQKADVVVVRNAPEIKARKNPVSNTMSIEITVEKLKLTGSGKKQLNIEVEEVPTLEPRREQANTEYVVLNQRSGKQKMIEHDSAGNFMSFKPP
ncbi:hypothetical protein KY290_013586 [Solanum tuberosum]|uniref:Uncharacterized protein n=1 Tax=Solanum tuberosum TaxID=4113 RepID=A0ABQ7VP81_SOLTU|nr:hypothetical protein KY289_013713 [Solanum tuberosum]KAH0717033.1 hypothetical protein KY285_013064 [Solanum tuberosum]KAH0769605.1 hypothetical protein KY290_013586 [Solanum tuberosum]